MGQDSPQSDPLRDLRDSLKWLIAASGVTAAALVAGLQLTALGGLPLGLAITGGVSAAVAIGVALSLLFVAARILTIPRPTANELCDRENNDPQARTGVRMELPKDPLLRWVYERRTRLLGDAKDVNSVYAEMVATRRALDALNRRQPTPQGKRSLWGKRSLSLANDADKEDVRAACEVAQGRLAAIEDAAHYHLTYTRFETLMKWFPWGAALFTIAVVGFALAPAFSG